MLISRIYFTFSKLCGDLVFVILFPQLVMVVHFPDHINTYGSFVGFFVGLTVRLLGMLLCTCTALGVLLPNLLDVRIFITIGQRWAMIYSFIFTSATYIINSSYRSRYLLYNFVLKQWYNNTHVDCCVIYHLNHFIVSNSSGGEPYINVPAVIHYPYFDYETNQQNFPFRTMAMLCSWITIVSISAIIKALFMKQILPSR